MKVVVRGLTIVELLVVVSIIAILASMAMINLMEAKTRSLVAVVQSDMRTLATAVELYSIDTNTFPRMGHFDFYGDLALDYYNGAKLIGNFSRVLSTPVPYITNSYEVDPFMKSFKAAVPTDRLYSYHNITEYNRYLPESQFWPAALQHYGYWRIVSRGPDRIYDHYFPNSAQLPYDATNGTFSLGNIIRSHKNSAMYPGKPLL